MPPPTPQYIFNSGKAFLVNGGGEKVNWALGSPHQLGLETWAEISIDPLGKFRLDAETDADLLQYKGLSQPGTYL